MKNLLLKIKPGTCLKWLFRPIVWVSDFLLGSDLANCEGCKRRQACLNQLWADFINCWFA